MRKAGFFTGISLFWLALSFLSDGITTILLPERLLRQVASNQQATILGLLSFAGLMAGMLSQPIAGMWSDQTRPRWGRKGILAIGTALTILSLLVFGFVPGAAGLWLGYLLVQICSSIIQAAQQGFIPDLVQQEQRGLASGFKGFMDIAGAMIGFVVLGQLLGAGQPKLATLVMAGLLLAALLLTVLLVREPRAPAGAPPLTQPSRNAYRINIRHHALFVRLVIARFFFLLGTYAVGRFLLLFVADRLGLPPELAAEQAGNLLAGLALVTVITAPLAGWAADRIGRRPLMLFGALISAIGVLAYVFVNSLGQLFLFGGMLSIGSSAFTSANWAMTADFVPKTEAGRFFGLANVGTAGAAAMAGLFGLLVDGVDRSAPGMGFTALFVSAAIAFVISAISLLKLPRGATAGTSVESDMIDRYGVTVRVMDLEVDDKRKLDHGS